MAATTNQIRITLALQGQAQVQAGLQQTARQTTAVGASAAGIEAELAAVTARLQAMGAAAAIATQQLQRVQLEQAGLGTTSDSAAQRLRRQQDETNGLGTASAGAGKQVGILAAAVRGAVAGFGVLGLVQVAQQISAVGLEFDALRGRIDKTSASSQQGAARFAFVTAEADRLGVAVRDTADNYADFLGATRSQGYSDAKRDNIFSALNEASAAYNLTQQQTNQNFDQLNRIAGKGKITLDDLAGSLGTNLPQTLDALALGLGVSNEQLKKMIADGQLAGRDVLPALAEGFRQTFGTDTRTQIQGTAADIQALKNQLLLTADALAKDLNPRLGSFARATADNLQLAREDPREFAIQQAKILGLKLQGREADADAVQDNIGTINRARDYVRANPFRPQLYDPNRRAPEPFFGPGRPAPDTLVGERLLTLGQTPPDAKAKKAAERDAQREMNEALREQKRIEAELQRGREASLKSAVDEEAARLGLIRSTRTQAAVIAEELRTGQALTGAARELFELKQDTTRPVDAAVEKELQHLAALEAQVKAIKDGDRAAQQARSARERADRQNEAFLRRRGTEESDSATIPGQFARNSRVRDRRQNDLDRDLERTQAANSVARNAERGTGTNDEQKYRDEDLELHRAYAEEKKRIDEDYRQAYVATVQAQFDGAASILGNLASLASVFGRKGFEAYRKFKIAEAIASTISGAIGAYNRASEAYPPPFGQVAGGIAAASVLVSGYAQVNQLRMLQPPGRRFGGPVSAGQPYELAESGTTEIFRDARSGRQYMIPGNSGEVTPARQASGGDSGLMLGSSAQKVNVNITNRFSGAQFTQGEARREADGSLTIEGFIDQANDPGSRISSALSRRNGARTVGTL